MTATTTRRSRRLRLPAARPVLRALRLRLPAWRSLWRVTTALRILRTTAIPGAYVLGLLASLLYIAGAWLADGLTALTLLAGITAPAGVAALISLLLTDGRR